MGSKVAISQTVGGAAVLAGTYIRSRSLPMHDRLLLLAMSVSVIALTTFLFIRYFESIRIWRSSETSFYVQIGREAPVELNDIEMRMLYSKLAESQSSPPRTPVDEIANAVRGSRFRWWSDHYSASARRRIDRARWHLPQDLHRLRGRAGR